MTSGSITRDVYLNRITGPATSGSSLTLRVVGTSQQRRIPSTRVTPQLTPLVGASVTIEQNRRRITQGATDKSGSFSASLKPGTYQLEVTHKGYDVHRAALILPAGRVSRQITLKPKTPTLSEPLRLQSVPETPLVPLRRLELLPSK